MKKAFATIITPDYMPFALSLAESISNAGSSSMLYVFVTQKKNEAETPKPLRVPSTIQLLYVDELCKRGLGKDIYQRYFNKSDNDHFRWSMKPVLINYLFDNKSIEYVFLVDCDIYFLNQPDMVFCEIPQDGVLLTPHWYPYSEFTQANSVNQYFYNFYFGVFNAGALGAHKGARHIIDWWAKACLFRCDKTIHGCYVDQGHLTVMQVAFDNVKICRNQGFNVAPWNKQECKRVKMPNGDILIDGHYEIVFIHFALFGPDSIMEGNDPLLKPYFMSYLATLTGNGLNGFTQLFKKTSNILTYHIERISANIGPTEKILAVSSEDSIRPHPRFLASSARQVVFSESLPKKTDSFKAVIFTGSAEWINASLAGTNIAPEIEIVKITASDKPSKPYIPERVLYLWNVITACKRPVALYGAGKYAKQLVKILLENNFTLPDIIFDDNPTMDCLSGVTVKKPSKTPKDMVIFIASDASHSELKEKAAKHWPNQISLDPYAEHDPIQAFTSKQN